MALDKAKTCGEADPDTGSEAFARHEDAIIQGMAVQATDGASVELLNGIIGLALHRPSLAGIEDAYRSRRHA